MLAERHFRIGAISIFVIGIFLIGCTFAKAQQQTATVANAPYMDTSLPIEVRVNDLISRMTLEEKASQLVNQSRAIPRLGVPAYDWWSEALHGVGFAGVATVFPQAIAMGSTWDTPLLARGCNGDQHRGTCEASRSRSPGPQGHL